MKRLIPPPAQCSEHLRDHLPLLWWKLHAIGPQELAVSPRLLNMKQLPLQSCWSLHPHTNESFTSKESVCVRERARGKVWESLICGVYHSLRPIMLTQTTSVNLQVVSVSAWTNIPALTRFGFKNHKADFSLKCAHETQMYVLSPSKWIKAAPYGTLFFLHWW